MKTAKRQRALQGKFISCQCPFGYKKNPSNPNQLVIDDEVVYIVKLIYELAIKGKGIVMIAKELTANKIITPAAYKASKGDTKFERYYSLRGEGWEYKWCNATVRAILRDMVYVGDMENRKYEVPNYKTKKRVRVPKEQHIIVKDTHQPIISREDFIRVQELMTSRHKEPKHNYPNLFKSMLICSHCGHRMGLMNLSRRNGKAQLIYQCFHHYTHKEECPKYCHISYDNIVKIVSERLRYFFNLVRDDQQLVKLLRQKLDENISSINQEEEKTKISKRLNTLISLTQKLYEDNIEGRLDNNTYSILLNKYQDEQKILTLKLDEVEKSMNVNKNIHQDIHELKSLIDKYIDFKELTREMIVTFINKITIEPSILNDDRTRSQVISITYQFMNITI